MAGLSIVRESFGSFEIRGARGVVLAIGAISLTGKVLLGALAIIPGCIWTIGSVVLVGGAVFHFGKKAYDSYKILVHLNSILTLSKMHQNLSLLLMTSRDKSLLNTFGTKIR